MCCQAPDTCNPQPPPSPFRHPRSTTRAHCIRELGIKQLMFPNGGKKLRSGTWKSFFIMEMEQKIQALSVNFLSLYLNPCTGQIHLSFSRSREGRGGYLKISSQLHENKARCWGAAALLQSFYGACPFRGLAFRSSGLHSPSPAWAALQSLHICRPTSRTQHISAFHERSLSVQLSGRDRPVPFSKVTMKYSTWSLIFKVFSHLFNGSWNTAITVKPRSSVVLPDLFWFTDNGNIHICITVAENKIEHGIYIWRIKIQITELNMKVI